MSSLVARLQPDPTLGAPRYAIGADGWSLVATLPILAGVTHYVSVMVDVPGGSGGASYRMTITGK